MGSKSYGGIYCLLIEIWSKFEDLPNFQFCRLEPLGKVWHTRMGGIKDLGILGEGLKALAYWERD